MWPFGKKDEGSMVDRSNVEHALFRLELAYDIAQKYKSLEATVLTMYSGCGSSDYEIVLYTNTTSNVEAELIRQEDAYWDIFKDEGKTCLCYKGGRKDNVRWTIFNRDVWNEAKKKHPEWKITLISSDKSAIRF